jgi:hypothetical protein
MANIIKALIVPVEEHLEKQEKFAELKQAERKAVRLAQRIEKLSQYVPDVSVFSLADMTDQAFENLLDISMQAHETQAAAVAQAEAKRVAAHQAAAAEQERIRQENIKLKEEAAARDAEIEAERRKREQIEKAQAAKAAEVEEAEGKALLAPDREKLLALADSIDALPLPAVSSRNAGLALDEARGSLARIASSMRIRAEEL